MFPETLTIFLIESVFSPVILRAVYLKSGLNKEFSSKPAHLNFIAISKVSQNYEIYKLFMA